MTVSVGVLASITTPDTVETELGTLEFDDGAPTPETAERLTTIWTSCAASRRSWTASRGRRWSPSVGGSSSVGVEDNQVLMFPELMDSASLFLTANCDTVYFWRFVDLTTVRW